MSAVLEPDVDLAGTGGDMDDEECQVRCEPDWRICGQPVEWELLAACTTNTHIARVCDPCRETIEQGWSRCAEGVPVQILCAVRTRA